jgi:hypothetical protein
MAVTPVSNKGGPPFGQLVGYYIIGGDVCATEADATPWRDVIEHRRVFWHHPTPVSRADRCGKPASNGHIKTKLTCEQQYLPHQESIKVCVIPNDSLGIRRCSLQHLFILKLDKGLVDCGNGKTIFPKLAVYLRTWDEPA